MKTANINIAQLGQTLTTADFFKAMPGLPKPTVYSRIRQLLTSGEIKRIGRGVYERSTKAEFTFEITSQIENIANELSSQFPYIDLCVWDFSPINSLAQHLINFNLCVVDVDRDAIEAVYDHLRETNERVLTTKRMFDGLADYDGYILVRKLVTDSPLAKKGEVAVPTLEKLLVDLACDKEFSLFQGHEIEHIFANALAQYVVNKNRLFRYAGRKNQRERIEQLLINNSSIN